MGVCCFEVEVLIMGLKDCIKRDIERVFLNTNDFCDNLVLQVGTSKINVIGSLQSNAIQNNSGNGAPLQQNTWTLYIKYPIDLDTELKLLSSGTRIMIDNKSYTVTSISDELGIATIQLNTSIGR